MEAVQVQSGELEQVLARNIRALMQLRAEHERTRPLSLRIADFITRYAGSMKSVAAHLAIFGGWILVNVGIIPGVRIVDPFPFVGLAMAASVEAIFLTSFVLVSQNRAAGVANERADLDLQINLLAEHEVTRLIQLTEALAQHLHLPADAFPYLDEVKEDIPPEKVLEEIEQNKPSELR